MIKKNSCHQSVFWSWSTLPKRMVFDGEKDAPQKAPDAGQDATPPQPEVTAPPPEKPLTDEEKVKANRAEGAAARDRVADVIHDKSADHREQLGDTQKMIDQNNARRNAVQAEMPDPARVGTTKTGESWTNKSDGSTKTARAAKDLWPGGEKTEDTIRKSVEAKYNANETIKGLLAKLDIKDANITTLIDAMTKVVSTYVNKLDTTDEAKITEATNQFGEGEFLPKITFLLESLTHIVEATDPQGAKIYPFQTAAAAIEAFSTFTQGNFFQNGTFKNDQRELYDFLVLDKASMEGLLNGFKQSVLTPELQTLETRNTQLMLAKAKQEGQKIDVPKMLAEGNLKFKATRIEVPAIATDGTKVEETFQAAITAAFDIAVPDQEIKKEAIAIAIQNFKNLNPAPQANEAYQLNESGELTKIDKEAEAKAAAEAAEAAKKPPEGTGGETGNGTTPETEGATDSGPLGGLTDKLSEWGEKIYAFIGLAITKLTDYLMKYLDGFGDKAKEVLKSLQDVVKWGPTPEMLKKIESFYDYVKEQVKKGVDYSGAIYTLLGDKEQATRVMNAKPDNLTWGTFLGQMIDSEKQKRLVENKNLTAKDVADILLTPPEEPTSAAETPPASPTSDAGSETNAPPESSNSTAETAAEKATPRSVNPPGYSRVVNLPPEDKAEVVAAAERLNKSGKPFGTVETYTAASGKKYALVIEEHKDNHPRGYGPAYVHPGVSALPEKEERVA